MSYKEKKVLHLYAHPQTGAYGQNSLTNSLIKEAHRRHPAEYKLITDLKTLDTVSKSQALIPITMSSSVSLELNMLGRASCVSNYSTSTPLGYNIEYEKDSLYRDIEQEFMLSKRRSVDSPEIQQIWP